MPKRDTEKFLRLVNEANERIAQRLAAEEEAKQKALRGDPVRVAADQARREKWGTLRARPRVGRRKNRARSVFGYVDPS
jgi:hypothetical protein